MVIDERIGRVEDTLSQHESAIAGLQSQHGLIIDLLTEIRDDMKAHRSRLDRLTDATTNAISVMAAAFARACDRVGHRVLLALSLFLGGGIAAALGLDLRMVLPFFAP
jgi:hypothetical protein